MSKTKIKAQSPVELSDEVMAQIKKGRVKIKPKWYFVLASLLLGVSMAGSLLLAFFFIGLIFFKLKVHQPHAFLQLGPLGLRPVLANWPILPTVLAVGGFIGAAWLLKRYDIAYKRNFTGLLLAILACLLTLGWTVDHLGLNEKLNQLKSLKTIYDQPTKGASWVVGQIKQINDHQLEIVTPSDQKVLVNWDEQTILPKGEKFAVGQLVRAVGQWQGTEFGARGLLSKEMSARQKRFLRQAVKGRMHHRVR